MSDRLIVDLTDDGRLLVGTWLDGESSSEVVGEPLTLMWPLDSDALEDLRWYLEDYMDLPDGGAVTRARRIEGDLERWGRTLHDALFTAKENGRNRVQAFSLSAEVEIPL